ncbi:hypothetical protein BWQ96_04177 [Gracilariopsis chorda]|uniref:Uncharacterized protein n=1 Tax=Gracilariopsis chorda TaxID=448386 RepID=A0A2V3IWI3_9FLOR|nr:hypothetical protein BWQ96_04177 [Gracilariopsis chorda]|eukprot:PXF46077.1 hypothetical protein BWQ96_04177 [Gracilariopsis chorda]
MATISAAATRAPRPRAADAQQRERRYERAIKQHADAQAMLALADLLQTGAPGVKQDPPRAHQLFQRAAKQRRSAQTLFKLAEANMDNPVSSALAPSRTALLHLLQESLHLEESAEALHASALLLYREPYKSRLEYDPDRAVQLLERAITHFDSPVAESLPSLAYLLASDKVSNPDPVRAVALYKRYIKLTQDPRAMNNLGILYHYGEPPIKPNLRRARMWYERALKRAQFPYAQARLASILANSSHADDIFRATRLLEQAISEVEYEPAVLLLASLYESKSNVLNHARAARLYRHAIRQFDSTDAMEALSNSLLSGRPGLHPNPCEALRLLSDVYNRTHDKSLRPLLAEVLWSGTATHAPDRTRALQLCRKALKNDVNANTSMASMLRYGHPPSLQPCPTEALRLLELIPCDRTQHVYVWKNMVLAILLSETDSPYPCLLRRVYEMFHEGVQSTDDSDYWLLWLPLHLRRSSLQLPVSGCPHRITHAVMVEDDLRVVSILNLSSLLLESHNILPDNKDAETALSLLECGVKKFNNHLIRINLAYVLWYGIGAVEKQPLRAIQLVEGVMIRSPHQLARTFLSCMLAERHADDLPRAVELWKQVTRSVRDVEEVRRLSLLISPQAAKAIVKYSQQPLLRHHAT